MVFEVRATEIFVLAKSRLKAGTEPYDVYGEYRL